MFQGTQFEKDEDSISCIEYMTSSLQKQSEECLGCCLLCFQDMVYGHDPWMP